MQVLTFWLVMGKFYAFILITEKCTWQDCNTPANSRTTTISDLSVAATAGIKFQGSQKLYRQYFGISKTTYGGMLNHWNWTMHWSTMWSLHPYLFDKCVSTVVNWQKMFREHKNIFDWEKSTVISVPAFLLNTLSFTKEAKPQLLSLSATDFLYLSLPF